MGAIRRGGRVGEHDCGALALLADCAPAIELRKLRWIELLEDESERLKAVAHEGANAVPAVTAAGGEWDGCVGQYRLEYPLPD